MALVLQGTGESAHIRVPLVFRDAPYVLYVGRAPDSDVVLPNKSVSARHARIEVAVGRVVIRDFGADGSGSRFGTLVGDQHMKGTAAEVKLWDAVCFGTANFGAHFTVEPYEHSENRPPPASSSSQARLKHQRRASSNDGCLDDAGGRGVGSGSSRAPSQTVVVSLLFFFPRIL